MNDLINRQEAVDILELGAEILRRVLDDMDVVGIDREKYSYGLKLQESDIEDIKELPPAQPERKTGRWIQLTCDSAEWWYCSECNGRVQMNPWAKYNYCPNCGTDMRSEQNE